MKYDNFIFVTVMLMACHLLTQVSLWFFIGLFCH